MNYSRPQGSQLGAGISPQSSFIEDRQELEERESIITKKFETQPITRPPHWGGFVLEPQTIEFWQGRQNRLHDRIIYLKTDKEWIVRRLAP